MYFTVAFFTALVILVPVRRAISENAEMPGNDVIEALIFTFSTLFIVFVLALMWPATMTGIAFYYLIKILDLRSQR